MKKTMLLALLVVVIIVGMTTPAYADRKAVSINIGKWTPDGYVNINIYHNDCNRNRYWCPRLYPPLPIKPYCYPPFCVPPAKPHYHPPNHYFLPLIPRCR
ncbi:MAG: hypothetical protein PHO28_00780 [Candidatus Pacebacteria bacterium]|nr:hypothetical protein [Candidatus Paceibacterota bacterium]